MLMALVTLEIIAVITSSELQLAGLLTDASNKRGRPTSDIKNALRLSAQAQAPHLK